MIQRNKNKNKTNKQTSKTKNKKRRKFLEGFCHFLKQEQSLIGQTSAGGISGNDSGRE